MGRRHLNVNKDLANTYYILQALRLFAGLLGGPEIWTPKEIIEYSFEILASHFMKTNEYFFFSQQTL